MITSSGQLGERLSFLVQKVLHIFRPVVRQYGLWDQIRVDQGKEWTLMLYIQEKLAHLRRNTNRAPHLQSTSKQVKWFLHCHCRVSLIVMQNHCIERIWVEINSRVNYPIKNCLVNLQASGDIDLDCPHQKFLVSWFTIRVATVGTTFAVQSWNDHTIPGTGNFFRLR